MGARSSGATEASEREVTITRIFDAPRSLVFRAWTSPEHLKRWWGPHGFTVLSCEMDFRVGESRERGADPVGRHRIIPDG